MISHAARQLLLGGRCKVSMPDTLYFHHYRALARWSMTARLSRHYAISVNENVDTLPRKQRFLSPLRAAVRKRAARRA